MHYQLKVISNNAEVIAASDESGDEGFDPVAIARTMKEALAILAEGETVALEARYVTGSALGFGPLRECDRED